MRCGILGLICKKKSYMDGIENQGLHMPHESKDRKGIKGNMENSIYRAGTSVVIVYLPLYCMTCQCVIYFAHGKPESRAAYPLLSEGLTLQTKERRALPMYVTYSDLIQIGIFICALVGLCYTIFKGKRK